MRGGILTPNRECVSNIFYTVIFGVLFTQRSDGQNIGRNGVNDERDEQAPSVNTGSKSDPVFEGHLKIVPQYDRANGREAVGFGRMIQINPQCVTDFAGRNHAADTKAAMFIMIGHQHMTIS